MAAQFCKRFLLATLLIAAAVAAFNAVVDPYLVFDTPRITSFNARKPSATLREELIKAFDAPRHDAITMVFGSSRSDVGMDPDTAPAEARPMYNMSLVGRSTGAGLRYLAHYLALHGPTRGPTTLLVGLDFEYFLSKAELPKKDVVPDVEVVGEAERRLAAGLDGQRNPARFWQLCVDYARALLSLDALSDSLSGIVSNVLAVGPDITPAGRFTDTDFRNATAAEGATSLFEAKDLASVKQYGMPKLVLRAAPDAPIGGMDEVDEFITFAHAHRMKMVLFVQPAHVDRLELLDRMGYWSELEEWKGALTQLVAKRKAQGDDIVLIDFSGFDDYSAEPLPPRGDRGSRLQWFWESVHYTTALGDLMMARMLHGVGAPSFGVELRPDNLEERLASVRSDRTRFRAEQPETIRRIENLYCRVVECRAAAVVGKPAKSDSPN